MTNKHNKQGNLYNKTKNPSAQFKKIIKQNIFKKDILYYYLINTLGDYHFDYKTKKKSGIDMTGILRGYSINQQKIHSIILSHFYKDLDISGEWLTVSENPEDAATILTMKQ